MKISEAIAQYEQWSRIGIRENTLIVYKNHLNAFCIYMKNCDIQAVTSENVVMYFDLQKTLGIKQNTFLQKASALRKFFEFFHEKMGMSNVLSPGLIPLPKKEYSMPKVADRDSYNRLLSSIQIDTMTDLRDMVIIMMLWDTGARVGELVSLSLDALEPGKMSARVMTEKSRGTKPMRVVFWTEETDAVLKRWIEKRRRILDLCPNDNSLFCALHKDKGSRLTSRGVQYMLKRRSEEAGLNETLNAHSFRHHLGREIIENGGTNSDVMNILGHASMNSSMIYTMLSGRDLEHRYRKIKSNSVANLVTQ